MQNFSLQNCFLIFIFSHPMTLVSLFLNGSLDQHARTSTNLGALVLTTRKPPVTQGLNIWPSWNSTLRPLRMQALIAVSYINADKLCRNHMRSRTPSIKQLKINSLQGHGSNKITDHTQFFTDRAEVKKTDRSATLESHL